MASQVGTIRRSSDEAFDQLLEELTVQIQAGLPVDLGACASEHPEYAERLRKLMPAMQALMVLGGVNQTHTGQSPSDISLRPTSGVLGDFRIVREIGRGGMGIVYEAEQISIGRPVALKVLPFVSMLDERRLDRFRNEVRAAGQLHHTNIVPVYAVGSDRGVHFYAMQLVPGQTLAEIIAELREAPQIQKLRTKSPTDLDPSRSRG